MAAVRSRGASVEKPVDAIEEPRAVEKPPTYIIIITPRLKLPPKLNILTHG